MQQCDSFFWEFNSPKLCEQPPLIDNLQCEVCHFQAKSKPGLKTHTTLKHVSVNHNKKSESENCVKKFGSKNKIKTRDKFNQLVETGITNLEHEDIIFQCVQCNLKFVDF